MRALRIKQNNNFNSKISNIKGAAGLESSVLSLTNNINKGKVEFNETSTNRKYRY